jgi:hypothetical protein
MGMPDREVVAIIEMEVFKWPFIRNYFPNQSSCENCSLKQWVLGMVRQWQQLFFEKIRFYRNDQP